MHMLKSQGEKRATKGYKHDYINKLGEPTVRIGTEEKNYVF